jgi:hypothetical protein
MTLFLIVLLSIQSFATAPAKAKRSGASSMMDPMDFSSCIKESVDGTDQGKCSSTEENPSCIGLKKSLEYFREKKDCMRLQASECTEWGTRGKTQAQWMAIAAGHLGKFGTCIRKRYGSDEDNGIKAATADAHFVAALRKMQDGGAILGFLEGEFLVKILEGDRFSVILQETPLARDMKPFDFYRIKDAADNPAKLEFILAGTEEQKTALSEKDPFYDFVENYTTNLGSISISANLEEEKKVETVEPNRIPADGKLSLKNSRLSNPYSLGLDRTLFERVSSAYQKRADEFRSVDELIKGSPAPPKDYRELLDRGGTL